MARVLAALSCLACLLLVAVAGCQQNGSNGQSSIAPPPPPPPPPPPTQSPALVALGQALFHDKVLSGNKDIACNTCHGVNNGSSDGLPTSIGDGGVGVATSRTLGTTGRTIARNSQALFNNAVTTQNQTMVFNGPSGAPVMFQSATTANSIAAAAPPMAAPAPATAAFAAGAALPGGASYGGVNETLFWDARVQFNPFNCPDATLNANTDPTAVAMRNVLDSPLAIQALFPVVTAEEMRGQPGSNDLANAPDNMTVWKLLMGRLVGTSNGTVGGLQGYRDLFTAAYPGVSFDSLTFAHATRGIAAYVAATFTATDTPFDKFNAGDQTALTAQQQAGMNLFFGTASCSNCHNGLFFSDFTGHGIATPQVGPGKNQPFDDLGIALTTSQSTDNYKFVTPSLRNCALTGPYMHDGCFSTLEAVIAHHANPTASLNGYDPMQLPPVFQTTFDTDPTRNAARIAAIDPLLAPTTPLAGADVANLVAFLQALTDPQSMSRAQAAKPTSVPSGLTID